MANSGKVTSRRGRTPADEKRPERRRKYQHLVLIVCEDTATERLYFEAAFPDLPENTVRVRAIGTGCDPLGVAQRAIAERAALAQEANREVDQVWLVFDKDDADQEPGKTARFADALALAKQEKMVLAFSNEVFELWLLLHFVDVAADAPLPRTRVYDLLDEALRQHPLFATKGYYHKKTTENKASKPADVLQAVRELGDETLAQARAEILLTAHADTPLLAANPSTRVHRLLQSLRGWVEHCG